MEAYASNAAIRRLKQEDCFEFKVCLRCIVKIQANLDCRMRPYPLKRPRTGLQTYSGNAGNGCGSLRVQSCDSAPCPLSFLGEQLSSVSRLFRGGGSQEELTELFQLSDTSRPETQKGDPRLLVWAQELSGSGRWLVIPIKNRSKKV